MCEELGVAEGERLCDRAHEFLRRVLDGEFNAVYDELGGLTIERDPDIGGFPKPPAIPTYEVELLKAIASKVFSREWEWTIRRFMDRSPQVVVLSYRKEVSHDSEIQL